MKTTGAACGSEELCRWKKKKKKKKNGEFRRFSCTRPFGYFKHVNS